MGSSRLPGKVMLDLGGRPLLGVLLDRLRCSRSLTGIVVATSTLPENDVIANFCRAEAVPCFRGDEDDVLGRMLGALRSVDAGLGIEIFGDCPLIDPRLVDEMIDAFVANGELDWLGNDLATTYPPGMEVEVFRVAALADAGDRCRDAAIREHGTLFIRQHPELYRIRNVEAPAAHHRPDLSVEVDAPEDFRIVEAILGHFAPRRDFTLAEIIAFLDDRPSLAAANSLVPRRWKQFRGEA
jgi:spore coat polysaccharide biosynthesis protein SpsF (cytidylyltransferase family)